MKLHHSILSLILPMLFVISCVGYSEDGSPPCPTEYLPPRYINHSFPLDSISNHWFAYNGVSYMKLRRPDGQIFTLNRSKYAGNYDIVVYDYDSIQPNSCRIWVQYRAKGAYKEVNGYHSQAPFEIRLYNTKIMGGPFKNTDSLKTIVDASSDKISLEISNGGEGNITLRLKDLKNYLKADKVFYDSTYSNVITVKGGYQISEMYLQENVGVIGFKFAGSNVWMLSYH